MESLMQPWPLGDTFLGDGYDQVLSITPAASDRRFYRLKLTP
jgi:hypothetical protein